MAWSFARSMAAVLTWRLALAMAVAIALAFAEGAGLLLLVPLLAAIGLAADGGPGSRVADLAMRAFAAVHLTPSLGGVLAVFVGLSFLYSALYRAHLLLGPALEQRYVTHLRTRLYAAILSARWSTLAGRRSSDLVYALTNDATRVATAAYQALTLLGNVAVSAIYVAFAARLSWPMTLTVAAVGLVLLWTQRGRTRRSADRGEAYSEATRRLFGMASQSLSGLKVAKSVGAEQRDVEIFSGLNRELGRTYRAMLKAFADSRTRLDLFSAVAMSGLLLAAVNGAGLRGAALLLLVFVFARVMPRVMSIQESVQLVASGLPSYQAIASLTAELERAMEAPADVDGARLGLERHIRLVDVSYRYASGVQALERVSLTIPSGRTVAIVGASGAGKSTLADLLMGLVECQEGSMEVDGSRLDMQRLRQWRRSVGYVPQEAFLLHDSIRANFRWAVPAATEPEMLEALDRAAARPFVDASPAGLDTIVGDRGVNLSGGERQRLTLARALLARPDLLIMDEATSALDALNEQQILRSLAELHGRLTIVMITHRLSAIRDADLIYVLEQGRVVGAGGWKELALRDGPFKRLLDAQQSDAESPVAP
jgi:ATP-binding cassette subfamily C protein